MLQVGDEYMNNELRVKCETIYHYTSFSVLPEFFKDDADLYCTNAKCLNDPTEIVLGARGFADYLRDRGVLSEVRHRLLLTNISEAIDSDWFDVWIMSLSMAEDDLSQWRGYVSCEEGGYAIGFDVTKLAKALKKRTPCATDSKINMIPNMTRCWYAKDEACLIEKFYRFRYEKCKVSFDRYAHADKLDPETIKAAVASILPFSMHIKHNAFRDEKEARIIINVPGCDYSKMRILGGKPRMPLGLPSLKEPLHSYINEIRISPHGQKDRLRAQVEWLKRKCNGKFKIVNSDIPYDPSR